MTSLLPKAGPSEVGPKNVQVSCKDAAGDHHICGSVSLTAKFTKLAVNESSVVDGTQSTKMRCWKELGKFSVEELCNTTAFRTLVFILKL